MPDLGCRQDADAASLFFFRCLIGFRFDGISILLLLYRVRNYRMCICRKDGLGIANTLRTLGRIDT